MVFRRGRSAKDVCEQIFAVLARKCSSTWILDGPIEGFWGILKRERYYGKRFTSRESIVEMIEEYIEYYNNKRLQRNLGVLTPREKHELYLQAA